MVQLYLLPIGATVKAAAESLAARKEHEFGVMTDLAGNFGSATVEFSNLSQTGNFEGTLKKLKLRVPWPNPLEGKPVSGFINDEGDFRGVLNIEE